MAPAFNTLERERAAVRPSKKSTHTPELHELIRPHLDSFNAIKETVGTGGKGKGLLELAIEDMDRRDVKDSFGNKLECTR
jgi:DNA-directed RNA polymerase I subunit RPA2